MKRNRGYLFSAIFTVLSFSVDLVYIEFIVKMINPAREM